MNCPKCNTILLPNSNFCPNCGYQINQIPQTIGLGRQLWIYFVSLFLPPFGVIWTFKYFRSENVVQKRVAYISLGLTIISIIFTIWFALGVIQGVQSQMNSYQNLGL